MVNIASKPQIYGYSLKGLFRILLSFVLFILCTFIVQSQELHTRSNRALKAYNDGKTAYEFIYYQKAEQYFREAVEIDPGFLEAHLMLAELSRDMKKYEQSAIAYKEAFLIDSTFFLPAWYGYGEAQFYLGNYKEAKSGFSYYLDHTDGNSANYEKATKYLMDCGFAIEAIKHPVDFNPVNMGENINTGDDEYWPAITADDKMLLFTRQIKTGRSIRGPEYQEDFYYSFWSEGKWLLARNAGSPLNTPYNEGAQTLEAGGNYMYFTACNREDGMGDCDIYYSARTGSGWKSGINIGQPVNSRHWESQPSLSSDGTKLYFVSNRPGGQGGMDIWSSELMKEGGWSEPENLGPEINTEGDEMSPFIHFDNKTLYFSSNGRPCMGGFDIYMSRFENDSIWSEPENLGYPINTQTDETGLVINSSGEVAYFSSRVNQKNGRDIFYFDVPQSLRPDPVSYLKGTVRDKDSGKLLKASYELINLSTRETELKSYTNSDGNFLVCLPSGHNYGINVSSENYLFYSESFMLETVHTSLEPYEKTILLSPIKEGELMSLHNIFFAIDSWELREESMYELSRLYNLLERTPGLIVEIGGHTDSTGSDEHNLLLSEKRAMAVCNYLIDRGIAAERLKYKGYGEKVPLYDNSSEDGKRKNRRTDIRVIEISE